MNTGTFMFLMVIIIIVSILLILVILYQDPKGGGLSSSFGGASSNSFGVKETNNFLDTATWTLASIVTALIIIANVIQSPPLAIKKSVKTTIEKKTSTPKPTSSSKSLAIPTK